MCITLIGKVLSLSDNKKTGLVSVNGKELELNLGLVDVQKGDFVSCAAGIAVEKLKKADALAILNSRRLAFGQK